VQVVWERLEEIDESLEYAPPMKIDRLFEERALWAKRLPAAQRREGYPDSRA
jgi:hypothetical protein